MRTRLLAATLMAMCLSFSALPASASFILGAITMSGDFIPTGGTGLSDATGIEFPGADFRVDGATEDFAAAGITQGDSGDIFDFQFAPFSPAPHTLWSIGGFDFELQAVSVVFQNHMFLVLEGVGEVSGNGFDATYGAWNLTANSAFTLFNFSSGTVVPEPGSLLLVSIGVLGFAATRRRRR